MNIHGRRYAQLDLFIGYCKDLNVKTNKRELEHYEKIGAMFPVARVLYPDAYVIQREQSNFAVNVEGADDDQWPGLRRLLEYDPLFPNSYRNMPDSDLVHSFDREFEAGCNPHLIRPGIHGFRAWREYSVMVDCGLEHKISSPTVRHYYSYWQVHQLYFIQCYPDLYKNAGLIARLPDGDPARQFLPNAPSNQRLVDFDGKRHGFDVLSFWITVYGQERNRTFADVPETDGVRSVTAVQFDNHLERLAVLAGMVMTRFQMTAEDLYAFLRALLGLVENYKRDERYKLRDALTSDIVALERLVRFVTGETRDEVAERLGESGEFGNSTFRHLDVSTRERDYSLRLLKRVAVRCEEELGQLGESGWLFTDSEAHDLLQYCEKHGLHIMLNALGGMVALGEEERRSKFRRVQRYTNIKNLVTACEYLFRDLAVKGNVRMNRRSDMVGIVRNMMRNEGWVGIFEEYSKAGVCSVENSTELLNKLDCLLESNKLGGSIDGYWARMFLVMCLARNGAVHLYPTEDRYYADPFGNMVGAAVAAIFYTWRKYSL